MKSILTLSNSQTDASNTILITGVAGFIGRYVARYFFQKGWRVWGIDNSPPENAPLSVLSDYHQLRLPNPDFHNLLKQISPNLCVHCAGRASVNLSLEYPSEDFYANTVLTFEILNALRSNAPQCKFIFLSSAAVYGNPNILPVSESHITRPISPYGFHKLQSEQLCLEFSQIYGLNTASVRIFSAYGPGIRRQVLWDICQKALTNSVVQLRGTGNESRDFIHAWDIAQAIEIIWENGLMKGDIYNLGAGKETTIQQLANIILCVLKSQNLLQFDNIVPQGNPLNWQADMTKLDSLGFQPSVPLEEGIETFVKWCQAELSIY